MNRGGAKELNDLMPDEARAEGGRIAGSMAVRSGRLREASLKGGARSREIAEKFGTNEHTRPPLGAQFRLEVLSARRTKLGQAPEPAGTNDPEIHEATSDRQGNSRGRGSRSAETTEG